ncbi:MAG: zinc-ribbon domain-containing protein [Ruminococcus sp.]
MYCSKCGKETPEGSTYCQVCGTQISPNNQNNLQPGTVSTDEKKNKIKCLPAFILGLIASIFGIFGGFCTTMCYSLTLANPSDALILIFGGSIIGLIGACLCLNKALLGSILQLVASVMLIICAYGKHGSDFQTVLAILLFIAGGIVGVVFSVIKSRKK